MSTKSAQSIRLLYSKLKKAIANNELEHLSDVLAGLELELRSITDLNLLRSILETINLKPKIENLKIHSNSQISLKAVDIMRICSSRPTFSKTFTITFGDVAENHAGMQKIGTLADNGFSLEKLRSSKAWFEARGVCCELVALQEDQPSVIRDDPHCQAWILIARNGLNALLKDESSISKGEGGGGGGGSGSLTDQFFREQDALEKDKKAKMRGRVVEKRARHNLCFAESSQEPDYESGRGRVIAFSSLPLLQRTRTRISEMLTTTRQESIEEEEGEGEGEREKELEAEGNYYYDLSTCGIGFHGDAERRKVVGIRVGASFPLHFQWFQRFLPVPNSPRIPFVLHHGDVYLFSEKATGHDWKRSTIPTLRHAAGAQSFLTIKEKEKNKSSVVEKKSKTDKKKKNEKEGK